MPFSISEFKSLIGENLPSSFYEVFMSPPVGGGEQIVFRTESVSLPGVAFMSVDNFSPYGNGKLYNIPYRYNPQEVEMVHFLDDKADLYKIFRDWANKIIDLNGDSKYGAKYMTPEGGGYCIDATVVCYNRQKQKAKEIIFYELYPININPVQMGWGSADDIAKLSVSYRFTHFDIK